jgi:hypothetical protein
LSRLCKIRVAFFLVSARTDPRIFFLFSARTDPRLSARTDPRDFFLLSARTDPKSGEFSVFYYN